MWQIEQKVENFIKQHNLLPGGAKVLLAVSGGADSVALLYILHKLIPNQLHIAHINHQLRGPMSLKDEESVKLSADKFKLPVSVEYIDVKSYAKENKLSIETAARQLRLAALCRIADKKNCNIIATAHQKNDNAETMIHRLLRGTGFKGLAGIRPKSIFNDTTFIRPLLCLSRNEIEDYLISQNINWQTDHTNLDCRFTRNRIRHKILPAFEKDTPELLFNLSQISCKLFQNIEQQAQKFTCHTNIVDIDKFNNCPAILKIEIIQLFLAKNNIGLRKMTAHHYDKIIRFLQKTAHSKTLQLPNNAILKKEQKNFYFSFPQAPAEKSLPVQLKIPGSVQFDNWKIETEILSENPDIKNKDSFIEWFDLEQLKLPLIARCREKGDNFKPFGLSATKKVGKFITSQKIDSNRRKELFLISDNEKILWLAPIRRNNEAVITNNSGKLLQIKISLKTP